MPRIPFVAMAFTVACKSTCSFAPITRPYRVMSRRQVLPADNVMCRTGVMSDENTSEYKRFCQYQLHLSIRFKASICTASFAPKMEISKAAAKRHPLLSGQELKFPLCTGCRICGMVKFVLGQRAAATFRPNMSHLFQKCTVETCPNLQTRISRIGH